MTTQLSPLRVGRVTASRVPIILGLSPYETRGGLLREMVREAFGAPSEWVDDDLKSWGKNHEEQAREAYEKATGNLVLDAQDFVVHPEIEWGGCSPDGLVDADGMFEAKCPPPRRGKWTSFQKKPHYLAQIQWQLACTGRAWCDGVIWRPFSEADYLGCEPLIIERIAADPDWLPNHLGQLAEFIAEYREIIADETRAAPFLAPVVQTRTDAEWADAAARYQATLDGWKAHEAAKEDLKRLADGHPCAGFGVTVDVVPVAGPVDWKKIAEKHAPGVDVDEFRKASTSRTSVKAAS